MTMLSFPIIRRSLCCWLIFTNFWVTTGFAQRQPAGTPAQPAGAPAPPPGTPAQAPADQPQAESRPPSAVSSLKIFVLEGADAVHVPQASYAPPLVVEVRDQNDRPLESVDVQFQLPSSGPGGFFAGQKLIFQTKTNYQGQAEAATIQPNNHAGTFTIVVTASLGALKRSISVNQAISTRMEDLTEKRRSRKWLWIGLAGGAAAGLGIYFAVRGNGSTASGGSNVTLTPGLITIGAPR
jgi:hypothetical protein